MALEDARSALQPASLPQAASVFCRRLGRVVVEGKPRPARISADSSASLTISRCSSSIARSSVHHGRRFDSTACRGAGHWPTNVILYMCELMYSMTASYRVLFTAKAKRLSRTRGAPVLLCGGTSSVPLEYAGVVDTNGFRSPSRSRAACCARCESCNGNFHNVC